MNKTVIADRIIEAIHKCENALRLQEDPIVAENSEIIRANLRQIDGSHSGSWLGYHSFIYYRDFNFPPPGDHFSSEWGFERAFSNSTSENWLEYAPEAVEMAAMTGVDPSFKTRFEEFSKRAEEAFEEAHDTVVTIGDILLDHDRSATLERLNKSTRKLTGRTPARKYVDVMGPKGKFMSRDSTAVMQGFRCPPHAAVSAEQASLSSPFVALKSLAKSGRKLLKYMEIHDMVDRSSAQKAERVFIGHGRSRTWRDLKDFLQDRLGLSWEEFNREPAAGLPTSVRLEQMLDNACFAFLVMTAEDEHADALLHARENVIHEVGLFQGRLGFTKSIVLLEEGCKEFSNIEGLGQIRFPAGDIAAKFEEIRRVLEREGLQ